MASTANCIACALNIHRIPAVMWGGYVVQFDESNFKKRKIVAGFCKEHIDDETWNTMPHHPEICRERHCYGLWTGDMGIELTNGDCDP